MGVGRPPVVAEVQVAALWGGSLGTGTGEIQAYADYYLTNEYVPIGNALKADLDFLKAQNKGTFYIGSRTDADDKWIVSFDPITAPPSTWLYDRRARTLTELYPFPLNPSDAADDPTHFCSACRRMLAQ